MSDELVCVSAVCPFCGTVSTIIVYSDDLDLYKAGADMRIAFPYLNADEREVLISGICPTCSDNLFV